MRREKETEPIERTRTAGCPDSVFSLYCAHNMCECRESLADEHADDPRASRVYFPSPFLDNYSRIHGAHTFDSDSPRRATVLWIRFVSLLVGAASGNPRFSTSSFPLALPLGASSSTVHATGDRAKARVGEPWWEPPESPILVRPEPDPLPLKSHVILSCELSTLLTLVS